MKIAIRAGHNELATGCAALINEVVEGRSLLPHIIQTLRDYDNQVLDVTPGRMDRDADLAYGVRKANEWGADLFVSIHFNKAYNHYNGKIGAECWVYSKSDGITLDEQVAQRIVDKLAGAGFVRDDGSSRGVKVSNELYELKQTKMASVIVETCFVEATGDVELYRGLGHKKVATLIAEGILNKSVAINEGERKLIRCLFKWIPSELEKYKDEKEILITNVESTPNKLYDMHVVKNTNRPSREQLFDMYLDGKKVLISCLFKWIPGEIKRYQDAKEIKIVAVGLIEEEPLYNMYVDGKQVLVRCLYKWIPKEIAKYEKAKDIKIEKCN